MRTMAAAINIQATVFLVIQISRKARNAATNWKGMEINRMK
jgi:hypothetical protein